MTDPYSTSSHSINTTEALPKRPRTANLPLTASTVVIPGQKRRLPQNKATSTATPAQAAKKPKANQPSRQVPVKPAPAVAQDSQDASAAPSRAQPAANAVAVTKMEPVRIDDITVGENRRTVDPQRVADCKKSIGEVGLLNPIGVTPDLILIHGAHRLEACRQLGHETIMATICDLDKLHAELAQIDENLVRNQLNTAELARALARRKEIYEQLHPETRPVTRRGGPGRGKKKTSAKSAPVSFTEDCARKTGRSQRTIQEVVRIGKRLNPDAVNLLAKTPVVNNQTELDALADLSADEQLRVAKEITSGKRTSVREATPNAPGGTISIAQGLLGKLKKRLLELGIADAEHKPLSKLERELNALATRDSSADCRTPDPEFTAKKATAKPRAARPGTAPASAA